MKHILVAACETKQSDKSPVYSALPGYLRLCRSKRRKEPRSPANMKQCMARSREVGGTRTA